MRLLLIRHGQTPANVAGVIDTSAPGPGLTELGHEQAALIPAALAGRSIDGLYASTLIRTHLTIAPLAADRSLAVTQLPGIHEIEAGGLEKLSDRPSIRAYLETAFAWGLGNLDARMPGGGDGHDFFGRYDSSIAAVAAAHDTGSTAVVVSHGAAMRVWTAARAINIDPSYSAEHDIHNTGMLEFEGSPAEGWTLLSWQGNAVGGPQVQDEGAADPTGETLAEAREA